MQRRPTGAGRGAAAARGAAMQQADAEGFLTSISGVDSEIRSGSSFTDFRIIL